MLLLLGYWNISHMAALARLLGIISAAHNNIYIYVINQEGKGAILLQFGFGQLR